MRITQKTLAEFATLRNKVEKLKREYEVMKGQLIENLQAGATVQNGERYAEISDVERRAVAWKEVVIRLKSQGYADKVLAATKPTTYVKLTVR